MNRLNVKLSWLILGGILSMIGILIIQLFWIKSSLVTLERNEQVVTLQDSINRTIFQEKVVGGLYGSAKEIARITGQNVDLYQAVKQIEPNYYSVRIDNKLHPAILQRVLTQQFRQQGITEDFILGVYDCYTDSIVYGDYISFDADEQNDNYVPPQIKMENDAHYFNVVFPDIKPPMQFKRQISTAWVWGGVVMMLVLFIFGFSLRLIFDQRKLSDIKTDFINNMTHELKTPISTISLSSEMLSKEQVAMDPEKAMRYAKIIYQENNRLKEQVERVLNVAKLEKDQIELEKKKIHASSLLDDILDSFSIIIEQKDGELIRDIRVKEDEIYVDELHMQNAIMNLIDNAIKYSHDEPKIEVSLLEDGKYLKFCVRDHGIGIPKEYQRRMFEQFFRVPKGNVHNVKGFGLGLFYTKSIVEMHGGRIMLESEEGKGSSFYIWLPKFK